MTMIFDAHLDMAWNAIDWNRDLLKPVSEIREFESHLQNLRCGPNTVSWPELRRGMVSTIIATLLPRLERLDGPLTFFQSREAAFAACIAQSVYYQELVKRGELRHIKNKAELEAHLSAWEGVDENTPLSEQPPLGFILSMEGSWGVLSPDRLSEFYDLGLRILGPAHYGPDPYCHGTGSTGGFNEAGLQLLKEMEKLDILLDVTHLSDDSFWQAVEVYSGPILASHHNCRSLVPGDRQLTDDQIKLLIERDAVIGAPLDCWMMQPGWVKNVSDPNSVSLENAVDHIDHICQLAGSTKHCGIGTDLDGGFGKEQTPGDLDTIADLGKFADVLDRRGYSQEDIDGILFWNWIRFFQRAWS